MERAAPLIILCMFAGCDYLRGLIVERIVGEEPSCYCYGGCSYVLKLKWPTLNRFCRACMSGCRPMTWGSGANQLWHDETLLVA